MEVIDGDGNPAESPIAALTPTQSATVVLACKALRKMGAPRFHPGDEGLAKLATEGFTAEQLVRCAAEKSLRDAGLWDDPDVHPELFDLLTNGASQQAMGLTPDQHTAVRSAVSRVSVGYLAATLRGRRRDALTEFADPPRKGSDHGKSTIALHGSTGPRGSAVERVKAANAAAEERELGARHRDASG